MPKFKPRPPGTLGIDYIYCSMCAVPHEEVTNRLCEKCAQLPMEKKAVKDPFCWRCSKPINHLGDYSDQEKLKSAWWCECPKSAR